MSPGWPNDEIWTQTNPGTEEDKSIFGEVYYKFFDKFTLTLGGRQYWLHQTTDYTADGFLNGGPSSSSPQSNSESGFNPKVALAFQATDAAMLYASASKGFRSGGAQANFPGCSLPDLSVDAITHIRSDTLWTYEVGAKVQTPAVLISAAAYNIQWTNLQQQVALLCGFYAQVNGGKARINGGEIEATGHILPGWNFRLGLGYESTDIDDPGNLALFGVNPGTRIAGVPDFTASVGSIYTHPLNADTDGFVSADYSYQGNAVSLLVGGGGSEATRPGFSLVNMRFGIDHGSSEFSLNIHNVFNAKPNLGDIGYVGYAQLSALGAVIPQVAHFAAAHRDAAVHQVVLRWRRLRALQAPAACRAGVPFNCTAQPCSNCSCRRSCTTCFSAGQSCGLATALAVRPLMNVTSERSTWSRVAGGHCGHSAQPCARQRSNRRMYSRCTQALMRFMRRSAVTCPQNVVQKAHSVWRCSSTGSASSSSSSSSGRVAASTGRVSRSSMRRRMRRSAAMMMSCLLSK